jgi:hypothetical protein
MVKYPLQSMIGGTLLLTLAFSLNDGSAAQSEANLDRVRLACDSLPDRPNAAPEFRESRPVPRCAGQDSKK